MLINTLSFGQVIAGATDICPLRVGAQGQPAPYKYTISSPPFSDVDYVLWKIEKLGSDGLIDGYVSGVTGVTTTSYNSGANFTIKVLWGAEFAGQNVKISAVAYEDGYPFRSQRYQLNGMSIRGIDNGNISGNKKPTKCCSTEITYSVSGVGSYADTFEWINIPSGWTVNGPTNTSTLKVEPNEQAAGALTCRVRMDCSDPSYYKDIIANISRPTPTIALGAFNPYTGINKITGICANSYYAYQVPEVCGAVSYSWSFPPSWRFNSNPSNNHVFWVAGQGTRTVVIKTANAPQNGQIIVTANFNGCASVSTPPIPALVLPAPPAAPSFINVANEFFHCGEWKFCNTGNLEVTKPSGEQIESYTWSITPPWHFQTPQGSVQTFTTAVNFLLDGVSPTIVRSGNGTAQLSVYATNCKGNSATSSVTLVPEDPAWCPGTPFWMPYPLGCSCCQPGGGGNPQYKQEEAAPQFVVYPNPSEGNFAVQLPNFESSGILTLTDMSGKQVLQMAIKSALTEVRATGLAEGIYLLHVTTPSTSYNQQISIAGHAH